MLDCSKNWNESVRCALEEPSKYDQSSGLLLFGGLMSPGVGFADQCRIVQT